MQSGPMSQESKPFLSVIIPAFNEERRLPSCLESVVAFLSARPFRSEIIVVTDGSRDRTAEVARSFEGQFSNLQTIEFKQNKGKGFAVKAGMLAATGQFRLFMDADCAVPIDFAPELLQEALNGAEIVIGSRGLKESKFIARQGFVRQQLAIAFGYLQRVVLQLPYLDTQCGFKLFTELAANHYFPLLTFDCAYFDAELLYIAHRSGSVIREVPVTWRHDQETRLPIGTKRTIEIVRKLFSIRAIHRNTVFRRDEPVAYAGLVK